MIDNEYAARIAWLNNLKPGDEVIVESRHRLELRRVERRTPSGRILVDVGGLSSAEFNPDGHERGRDSFYRATLKEPTQELRDMIERTRLIDKIARAKVTSLSLDTLRQIAALLEDM